MPGKSIRPFGMRHIRSKFLQHTHTERKKNNIKLHQNQYCRQSIDTTRSSAFDKFMRNANLLVSHGHQSAIPNQKSRFFLRAYATTKQK